MFGDHNAFYKPETSASHSLYNNVSQKFSSTSSSFKFGSKPPEPQFHRNFGCQATTSSEVHEEGSKMYSQERKKMKKYENFCVEASTQTDTESCVNKLVLGLKDILMNEKYSDATFIVKDKKFKVHRNILAARSPVFASLIESENPVYINDDDPDIFADFLYFVYTGSTEKLNQENVTSMYTMAKKYKIIELSAFCVKYMMDHISLDNFCNVMNLALQYHEQELFDVGTQYFMKNAIEIAETANWLIFLENNTMEGNSLFLKTLKLKGKEM